MSVKSEKVCFVTIGATASFVSLINATTSQGFLAALRRYQYTHLRIQAGKDADVACSVIQKALTESSSPDGQRSLDSHSLNDDSEPRWQTQDLIVESARFRPEGLQAEMKRVNVANRQLKKDDETVTAASEGCVVSHAGSGSILDAMRLDVQIIVVPNEELMDNHQVELAEELDRQGYVVYGHLDNLPAALDRVEALKASGKGPALEASSGAGEPDSEANKLIEEEMGFFD